MSLTLTKFESDGVYCASVVSDDPIDAHCFAELSQALDAIRAHLDSGSATCVALEANVRGATESNIYNDRIPEATVDEFMPFARFSTKFWDQALENSALHRDLVEFVAKVEDLSQYATREDGGIWYLCETDVVLFCQPILCYLAMRCLAFVPSYTRMLAYWRTEEASDWLAHDVFSLVERHGRCNETLALVRSYFANGGSHLDPDEYADWLEVAL